MARARIELAIGLCVGLTCGGMGCGPVVLTLEDVVLLPERASVFVAQLERETPFGVRNALEDQRVTFWLGNQFVGTARTDAEGLARLVSDAEHSVTADTARAGATLGFQRVRAKRPVYRWNPDRVIVAVDIDHTISRTDHASVLLEEVDTQSTPLPGAIEGVEMIQSELHLLYLTARPSFLREKSREWIALHGFPAAPLIMPPHTSALLDQAETKRKILTERREFLPNLLIGIGDTASDAIAYSSAGMLGIILAPLEDSPELPNVVVMDDWSRIVEFFAINAETLAAPERLADLLEREAVAELVIPIRPEDVLQAG
jgi:hypothetical protein